MCEDSTVAELKGFCWNDIWDALLSCHIDVAVCQENEPVPSSCFFCILHFAYGHRDMYTVWTSSHGWMEPNFAPCCGNTRVKKKKMEIIYQPEAIYGPVLLLSSSLLTVRLNIWVLDYSRVPILQCITFIGPHLSNKRRNCRFMS